MDTASPIVLVMLPLGVATLLIVLIVILVRHNHKLWLKRVAELSEDQEYDLIELWNYRFVLPRATGQTITHINAQVENRTEKRLRVLVKPGTYFVSSGGHQNMVARSEHRFTLRARSTEKIYVPASCINAALPIPGAQDQFHGVAKVSNDLVRFLEKARGEDDMVVQAGVWALTDGYSKYDIQTKLVARSSSGSSRPAVSDQQVARAKRILDELGIGNRL